MNHELGLLWAASMAFLIAYFVVDRESAKRGTLAWYAARWTLGGVAVIGFSLLVAIGALLNA